MPEQIFEHRLAALLGLTLGEIDELPEREIERWRRYWVEEPWGSYRDNMHAALIAIQVLRPHRAEGSRELQIDDFMLKHVDDAKATQNARMIASLETQAIRAERAERRQRKKP